MQQWQARPWPGNVRELRNFADRLVLGVAQSQGGTPETADSGSSTMNPLVEKIDSYECALIAEALKLCDANVALTADHLGIPKKTLYDKIKKYRLKAAVIPT
jgi:two-component system C4-dicarboxylate transport response regulator DctD